LIETWAPVSTPAMIVDMEIDDHPWAAQSRQIQSGQVALA